MEKVPNVRMTVGRKIEVPPMQGISILLPAEKQRGGTLDLTRGQHPVGREEETGLAGMLMHA